MSPILCFLLAVIWLCLSTEVILISALCSCTWIKMRFTLSKKGSSDVCFQQFKKFKEDTLCCRVLHTVTPLRISPKVTNERIF